MEETLMKLVGEHAQVMEMINDPDVDQQTVLDTLDSIEGAIEVKAEGYGMVLRGIKYEKAGLKAKRDYLQGFIDQIDKKIDNLDKNEQAMYDRLMAAMIATGLDETGIKTDQFEFKINLVGGQQALDVDDDVPDEFLKKTVVVEKDKAKIREYIKDHNVKWARLLPKKRKLVIKGV